MRLKWWWGLLVFGLATLEGCSCQSLPDVVEDGGGEAGLGGGEQCGGELVDVMSNPDHCGVCDYACIGSNPCIDGSCVLVASSQGAWAAARWDDNTILWSHSAGGALERTSIQDGSTDQTPGNFLFWDINALNGYIGVVTMDVSFVTGLPQWLTWGQTTPTNVCTGTCKGYDVAVANDLIVFGTDVDVFWEVNGGISSVGGFPRGMLASSRPYPHPDRALEWGALPSVRS
jgi:hypothetical protein